MDNYSNGSGGGKPSNDINPAPVQRVMEVEMPVGDPKLIAKRHEESVKRFPDVQLDDDEYVVISVRRHPIGVTGIWLASMLTFVVVTSLWILTCFMPNKFHFSGQTKFYISLMAVALIILSLVCGYIGNYIYKNNKFIVTNERVIQKLLAGLFNQKKQLIRLESIEDISFTQVGIFSHMFGYGTIRLSTVGDESTYTYTLVKYPNKQAELLSDIVENAKENRCLSDEIMEQGRILGN